MNLKLFLSYNQHGRNFVNTVVSFGVSENTLGLSEIAFGLSGISAALSLNPTAKLLHIARALPHYAPKCPKMPQNAPLFFVDANAVVMRYPFFATHGIPIYPRHSFLKASRRLPLAKYI